MLVVTVADPRHYTPAQIDLALSVQYVLGRGELHLLEPPAQRP